MDARICDECGINPSTVHFTQIIDGETHLTHLCEECAEKKGISVSILSDDSDNPDGFSDLDMDDGIEIEFEQKADVQCSNCNQLLSEFKETGKLGCPHCYMAFKKDIDEFFNQVSGSCKHVGKTYSKTSVLVAGTENIEQLRLELNNAIRNEDFELAAVIRDKIKSLSPDLLLAGKQTIS